jgi:colanic acid/amylovoran biosynthesis glycosyltransferase
MFLSKKKVKAIGHAVLFCVLSCPILVHALRTERPLNILFVVTHFPSPSQTFILRMITNLIDNGHNVSIFALKKDKQYNNVDPAVYKYNLWNLVTYEKFSHGLPKCDIIFCQFGYVGQAIAEESQYARWVNRRKLVVCFRGSDITSSKYVKDTHKHIYNTLFRKADLVLPVCDYFRKRLIALGCDPHKIIVHHSAIDCSQFFFKTRKIVPGETIRCISVCRLVKKKGIRYALKAIAEVMQKYPNIHFTIVGDGEEKEPLKRLARELKIDNKVTFYGWATQAQVTELLDKAHIFLLPSITANDGNEEGIPNAVKEAMATGLISIATWHAGNGELIEDKISGFLVEEKNVPQLAQAIEYTIQHTEEWEAIGRAARKKVKDDFEIKKVTKRLEGLFNQLLDRKKAEEPLEEYETPQFLEEE